MTIKTELMHKNGIAAMSLARKFMNMNVGDRIETIARYAEIYKSARGTIQIAMKLLQDDHAIMLEPRGHLGTFITYIDYKKLVEFSDIKSLIGVMPLPYSKLYEGLATGLYLGLAKTKLPFSLAYMRGAKSRLESLQSERCDFAVVSKLAAKESIKEGFNIIIAMEFGKYTYVHQHTLVFHDTHKSKIEDGMKVGIDYSSYDHYLLTERQCQGKNVHFIELPYNQIISKVIQGEIDAAIWNVDEINERKINLNHYPLSENFGDQEDTEAVLIISENKTEIQNLLHKFLVKEEVLRIQNGVVKGVIIPSY